VMPSSSSFLSIDPDIGAPPAAFCYTIHGRSGGFFQSRAGARVLPAGGPKTGAVKQTP
jgi:hypothetical protein